MGLELWAAPYSLQGSNNHKLWWTSLTKMSEHHHSLFTDFDFVSRLCQMIKLQKICERDKHHGPEFALFSYNFSTVYLKLSAALKELKYSWKCSIFLSENEHFLFITVRANYWIRYRTKSGKSVPDLVHPIPQCIDRPKLFEISNWQIKGTNMFFLLLFFCFFYIIEG